MEYATRWTLRKRSWPNVKRWLRFLWSAGGTRMKVNQTHSGLRTARSHHSADLNIEAKFILNISSISSIRSWDYSDQIASRGWVRFAQKRWGEISCRGKLLTLYSMHFESFPPIMCKKKYKLVLSFSALSFDGYLSSTWVKTVWRFCKACWENCSVEWEKKFPPALHCLTFRRTTFPL